MTKEDLKHLKQFETFIKKVCKVKPAFEKDSGIDYFAYYVNEVFLLNNYIEKTTQSYFDKVADKMDDENELKIELRKSMKRITSEWYVEALKQ